MDINCKHSERSVDMFRSLVGSLGRPSPFPSPSSPATATFFRAASPKTGKYTQASIKPCLAPSPNQPETPPLERSIDVYCRSKVQIDQYAVCESILSDRSDIHNGYPLFNLPASVRRRIYDYCFDDEPRKISLSPRFATKAVFPDDYLASPWDVLEPVWGGLRACPALRNELMIYFWTQYHFHATLGPFTGPAFSPLSSVWLVKYLDIIQYISVEADLTRFGFGHSLPGANFGHNVNKTEVLLIGVANGLAMRRGKTTMAEFNVMCRRYNGFRPEGSAVDWEPLPYSPDDSLYFCDSVSNLQGFLQKCRMSGFTQEYSERTLRTVYYDETDKPLILPSNECAWPPIFDKEYETPGLKTNEMLLSLMMPCPNTFVLPHMPSSNLSEEIEKELRKYESNHSGKGHTEETSVSGEHGFARSETTRKLAGHPPQESLSGSKSSSWSITHTRDDDGRGLLSAAAPFGIDSRCTTPQSRQSRQTNEDARTRILDDGSAKHLLTATPANVTRTPKPQLLSDNAKNLAATSTTNSQASPNKLLHEMNRRNEQDPAFVRTVDALRAADDEKPNVIRKARPVSMIPSPIRTKEVEASFRAQTSLGAHPRSEGTVRRYLSFVKRLRGGEH